jgi:hypothetical protein
MKLYLCINQAGTHTDIGLHCKLAILSALKQTQLKPHLLYAGEPNDFTRWIEAQGAEVIPSRPSFHGTLQALTEQGRYSMTMLGHWLRTNICLEELDDDYVLYTDVDVVFRRHPALDQFTPEFFMAAPEFHPDRWNYINSGVMLMHIPALRAEYPQFERYLISSLTEHTYGFHDQIAYNVFFRGQWDRLPVEFNWKPYWGMNDAASIVHFHGPKIGAIAAMVDRQWDYSTDHGRQIGSLFNHHVGSYISFLESSLRCAVGLPPQDFDRISQLIDRLRAYAPPADRGDLAFQDFRMFADDE